MSRPTVKAPDPLGFDTIDWDNYYEVKGRNRTPQVRGLSDDQISALAKQLGLTAPKVGKYYQGKGGAKTGMNPKDKVAFVKNAESYYNTKVDAYNEKVEAYNKEWEGYNKLQDERKKELSKPLTELPNREDIGRAAAERKGNTNSQALRGNMSMAETRRRMQNSASRPSTKRESVAKDYQPIDRARKYADGGMVDKPVVAAPVEQKAQAQYQPPPPININAIKQPQIIQNMNMGNVPAYTRTGGLKVK